MQEYQGINQNGSSNISDWRTRHYRSLVRPTSNSQNLGYSLKLLKSTKIKDFRDAENTKYFLANKNFNIKKLSDNILKEFFNLYNYYNQSDLDKIMKEWEKYCDTIGKNITVTTKKGKIKGKAIGVDENCNLILKLSNNKLKKIIEGDVRVRY